MHNLVNNMISHLYFSGEQHKNYYLSIAYEYYDVREINKKYENYMTRYSKLINFLANQFGIKVDALTLKFIPVKNQDDPDKDNCFIV